MALALAGCGGGGGGGASAGSSDPGGDVNTLRVSLEFKGTMSLMEQSTVTPSMLGFQGHAPNCNLQAGTLPVGVQLRSDCVLEGRPADPGMHSFTVRVTVPGYAGSVDFSGAVFVASPVILYHGHAGYRETLTLNAPVHDLPELSGWAPSATEPVNWTYSLRSGALPPGLALDPATGVITGSVAAEGSFTAVIHPRLVTSFGSFDLADATYSVNVAVPTFSYGTFGETVDGVYREYLGARMDSIVPTHPDLGTLSNFRVAAGTSLPAGVTLDPQGGGLYGTPQVAVAAQSVAIEATVTAGGVSNTTVATFRLEVVPPVAFGFDSVLSGSVGAPFAGGGHFQQVDKFFFQPVDMTLTQRPGACTLPPGLTLGIHNGQLTGTPTAAGNYDCVVDVAFSVGTVAWTQPAQFHVVIQ